MTNSTRINQRLSKTVQSIQPSGIRRFFDLASTMDNIISLGVGEPDFVTPWNIREAAFSSMERGFTAYTANAGLLELREEISKYMSQEFSLHYSPASEVLVTVGASEAIDIAIRSLVDPGDEVIVVEPTFVSYAPIVSLAGGVPVSVGTKKEDAFKLTPAQLEAAITPKTKLVMLCFPNNPTGAVMTKEELELISHVIKKHDLLVLSDEIYAELSYDTSHYSIARLPDMRERTVVISGFSKAFAMTGWRLGFTLAPEDITAAMLKIHQYTMMCASTPAQYGALEALQNGLADVKKMVQSYHQRRNFVVKSFAEIGLPCHTPGGAFYAFPSIKNTGFDSGEFAEKLLLEERVAVVPGNVFGAGGEGHIRCSYATSMENLEESVRRIGQFLEKHC
ncbi:aminotransferase [Alkalihalobacterium chitinilyticum]|uniref:Aminotransferase n=1 Tax=Alkalihalobacterium chitinilyticum TaxID=2980103 RepID=A0ABT5VIT9_9BACI|nr:aminotransferase [Alkalihalobacterium chitinilyticum]MDE5415373.1 aminotransferase [Alkalihalobacterium chitinilyticum]